MFGIEGWVESHFQCFLNVSDFPGALPRAVLNQPFGLLELVLSETVPGTLPDRTRYSFEVYLVHSKRDLKILQRPFAHEADAVGGYAVDDQFGIIDRTEILPQQRAGFP